MFKQIVLAVMVMFLMVGIVQAQGLTDIIERLPEMNQTVIYSLDQEEFEYATTTPVANWTIANVPIEIDAGYSPSKLALVSITTSLLTLKDYVNIPILSLMEIEVGAYLGLNRIEKLNIVDDSELDYGLIVKLLSLKF